MTTVLKVSATYPEDEIVKKATELISSGRIVAYPTDTVYGVGTNALNPDGVLRIFELKRRPLGEPLPVAVRSVEMAKKLAFVTRRASKLMQTFWPGALTLVLFKKSIVPEVVTAGQPSVAIRAPNHQVPLKIVERSGLPLIATSANIHGMASCTDAQDVVNQLGDKVDLVLDCGHTEGIASTILDLTGDRPRILRPGPVTRAMMSQSIGISID